MHYFTFKNTAALRWTLNSMHTSRCKEFQRVPVQLIVTIYVICSGKQVFVDNFTFLSEFVYISCFILIICYMCATISIWGAANRFILNSFSKFFFIFLWFSFKIKPLTILVFLMNSLLLDVLSSTNTTTMRIIIKTISGLELVLRLWTI